jgi:pyruvate,water dikinase
VQALDLGNLPATRTQIVLNLANPAAAFPWWRIPADGVGLARMEFVMSNYIKVHPMALVHFDMLKDEGAKRAIEEPALGYADKSEYFVDRLARGLARIAAAHHPKPVIVRMSDFKTNEYANLVGGAQFEPEKANPVNGFRGGASRYYSPRYRDGFALECRAIRGLREDMGFGNVIVMIPFCRSTRETDRVLQVMDDNGFEARRGRARGLCHVRDPLERDPGQGLRRALRRVLHRQQDLTQLTLGVDRDSEALAELFDEQDAAVKWMMVSVIQEANKAGAKVGLCGQAPSDHPEFAAFLVGCGIDSMSVSPDTPSP